MHSEEEYRASANRLHHLSMHYAGALLELAQGKPWGMIPQGYPGLKDFRDLADIILFVRAEVNAHTRLMVEAGLITKEQAMDAITDEMDFFTQAKAKQFGIGVNDAGLVFTNPNFKEHKDYGPPRSG